MRMKPLLAVVCLALAAPLSALAADRLPADWEQTVAKAIPEPDRAQKVVAAGRQFDAKWQESSDAIKAADAKLRRVFLGHDSSTADRAISVTVFRDARRKALMSAVDSLFRVKALVSKKEWKAIWPEGFFALGRQQQHIAEKVLSALPSVVTDPVRQKQALDVAGALVKNSKTNISVRDKARARLEKNLADYGTPRDEFIESVNDLEATQTKRDDALVDGATQLQSILTADEWSALMGRVTAAVP